MTVRLGSPIGHISGLVCRVWESLSYDFLLKAINKLETRLSCSCALSGCTDTMTSRIVQHEYIVAEYYIRLKYQVIDLEGKCECLKPDRWRLSRRYSGLAKVRT